MACERWREMLSAQLDGEDDPADRGRVDEHLAGCAGCREWLERAAAVNRLTRTVLVADVPDLSDAILAALAAEGSVRPAPPAIGAESPALGALPLTASASGALPASASGSRIRRGWWNALLRDWFAVTRAGDGEHAGRAESGLGGRVVGDRLGERKAPWRARVSAALYVALAAVGAVQLILGLAQVGGGAGSPHVHTDMDATPGHLWHESAAWNVAVGAGFLFIALRRNRPTGLVPMLTAFVGMLLLLSVNDLSAARVDATRLVSHGFVILGYLIVVALSRVTGEPAQPPGDRAGIGAGWHLTQGPGEAESAPRPPKLRLVPPGPLTAAYEPGPLTAAYEPGPLTAAYEPGQLTAAYEPGPLTAGYEPGPLTAAYEPGTLTAREPGTRRRAA
ncbi:zf-HC2 domain-containing protein [Actinoplanes sp. NPDC051346]|uniref:zf-HC2 domain-containing protein n=1 Tax=Actinoplanes sp. NPDC051346 TaxID=3155048 RepID=UPI003416384E